MGLFIRQETGDWMDISGEISLNHLQQPFVTERRDKLSFPFGDAEMVKILLPNIAIVYGDMLLKEQRFWLRSAGMPDMVELHFTLSGRGVIENHVNGKTFTFSSGQHGMMYVPEFEGTGYYANESVYKFFEVHFLADHFVDLVRDSCKTLDGFAQKVSGGEFAHLSSLNRPISFAMHQCIRDIMQCPYTGRLKLLFLQAKCVELLTLQAEALERANDMRPETVLKSEYDKQCIVFAKEYLLRHMQVPPSLPELAVLAGTNEFKLKKGFKAVYNNTVFGYLSDARLVEAKELLGGGVPIKEVADRLGYSSVQHFGNAFRKKFGISPGKAK